MNLGIVSVDVLYPRGERMKTEVCLWFECEPGEAMMHALTKHDESHFCWEVSPPCWEEVQKIP